VKHRHLEIAPGTSVEEWPSAAIVDVLGQGDLDDWRPVAAAVARAPFGPFAARVLRLVDAYPRYGTSALWRAWIDRCRARAEGRNASAGSPMSLAEIRRSLGLTQAEVARRAGMSQSDLSKFERRADVRLGTLRDYAAAIGGRVRVTIEVSERAVEISPPSEPAPAARGRRRRRATHSPSR
jgi:DNA-binding XRE family transcriptional regulator